MEVRDDTNKVRLTKIFSKNHHLKYDTANTKYQKMCLTAHSLNKIIIQINHYFEVLIVKKQPFAFLSIALLFALPSLLISGVFRLGTKILIDCIYKKMFAKSV